MPNKKPMKRTPFNNTNGLGSTGPNRLTSNQQNRKAEDNYMRRADMAADAASDKYEADLRARIARYRKGSAPGKGGGLGSTGPAIGKSVYGREMITRNRLRLDQ